MPAKSRITVTAEKKGVEGNSLGDAGGATKAKVDGPGPVAEVQLALRTEPVAVKSWAELAAEEDAVSEPCEMYVTKLVESVRHRLVIVLRSSDPAVGGQNLQGTLGQQDPLQIDASNATLKSLKEHWRWESCVLSLGSTGLYEAPGNLFWLDAKQPFWEGQALPASDLTYGQLAAGRLMWSDEKFTRSSEDPEKRHYLINEAAPTAVHFTADVPTKAGVGFELLPCFGSRSVLAGFYSTMDDALRASDYGKVLKLYEAALSFRMRMRVAPSMTQVALDSITYSEELHAAKAASSDSFYDFAEKVVSLFPPAVAFGTLTVKGMQEHAGKLGVTYHGSKLTDTVTRALQNVIPYTQNRSVREAWKAFEDVSYQLNEQTKLSMFLHTTSKQFGKGTETAVGACVQVLNVLRASLIFKDIAKDQHVTKEFMVGGRTKAFYFL